MVNRSMWLDDIDEDLLARLWPSDRVAIGICVCKRVRRALICKADQLSLTSDIDVDAYFHTCAHSSEKRLLGAFALPQLEFDLRLRPQTDGKPISESVYDRKGFEHFRSPSSDSQTALGDAIGSQSSPAVYPTQSRFGWCGRLRKLDLDGFELDWPYSSQVERARGLGEMLSSCTSLSHLNISSTAVNPRTLQGFAVPLRHCRTLTWLDMSNNNLEGQGAAIVAGLIQDLPIRHLALARNRLRDSGAEFLAPAVSRCSFLEVLDVSRNLFTGRGAAVLLEALQHCAALQELDLSVNSVGDAAGQVGALLSTTSTLRVLSVRNAGFKEPALVKLVARLAPHGCGSLQDLDLSENYIGPEASAQLPPLVSLLPALAHLDLRENFIANAQELGKVLAVGSGLQTLKLAYNNVGCASTLAEGLRHGSRLQHLDLSWNHFELEFMHELSSGLRACGQLRQLRLSGTTMDSGAAKVIARRLKGDGGLQRLELEQCGIGPKEMKKLVRGVSASAALQLLNLSCNPLGDAGMRLLAAGIGHCQQLEELDLSGCTIGAEGAWLLARTVEGCRQLRELRLQNNLLRDGGARAVAAALPRCRRLHVLDLRRNFIGPSGKAALWQAQRRIRRPIRMDVEYNVEMEEEEETSSEAPPVCLPADGCSGVIARRGPEMMLSWELSYLRSIVLLDVSSAPAAVDGALTLLSASSLPLLSLLVLGATPVSVPPSSLPSLGGPPHAGEGGEGGGQHAGTGSAMMVPWDGGVGGLGADVGGRGAVAQGEGDGLDILLQRRRLVDGCWGDGMRPRKRLRGANEGTLSGCHVLVRGACAELGGRAELIHATRSSWFGRQEYLLPLKGPMSVCAAPPVACSVSC